jgi:hypothetical protein
MAMLVPETTAAAAPATAQATPASSDAAAAPATAAASAAAATREAERLRVAAETREAQSLTWARAAAEARAAASHMGTMAGMAPGATSPLPAATSPERSGFEFGHALAQRHPRAAADALSAAAARATAALTAAAARTGTEETRQWMQLHGMSRAAPSEQPAQTRPRTGHGPAAAGSQVEGLGGPPRAVAVPATAQSTAAAPATALAPPAPKWKAPAVSRGPPFFGGICGILLPACSGEHARTTVGLVAKPAAPAPRGSVEQPTPRPGAPSGLPIWGRVALKRHLS